MPEFGVLIDLDDMKGHLGLTNDQDEDDPVIWLKMKAAQRFIERELGFRFEERFEAESDVPADLREAIMQLAAWWYENREAVTDRGSPLPFGVADILAANRDWSF